MRAPRAPPALPPLAAAFTLCAHRNILTIKRNPTRSFCAAGSCWWPLHLGFQRLRSPMTHSQQSPRRCKHREAALVSQPTPELHISVFLHSKPAQSPSSRAAQGCVPAPGTPGAQELPCPTGRGGWSSPNICCRCSETTASWGSWSFHLALPQAEPPVQGPWAVLGQLRAQGSLGVVQAEVANTGH